MPANKMKKGTKLMQDEGNAGLTRFDPPKIKGKANKMTKGTALMKDNYEGGLSFYKPPTR